MSIKPAAAHNVLLSRAKWMMIVVGCLDFYQNVVEFSQVQSDVNVGFLKQFLDSLALAQSVHDAVVIDLNKAGKKK
ncbi:hypothetical protein [Bradyrhizobium sp.]|uniref:hypothetical protein n=1 Tax=Bradyrhizobium sp. TaxID=376 RepID=UPI002734983A|nr:hypothetical protein [Bradyrhizobium sp.]MDP3077954.1 hypothetical protein [Bradyrhizobium sp.]